MSDRLVLALAAVPMVAGVLLVSVLQRGDAVQAGAPAVKNRAGAPSPGGRASLAQPWLGVVTAGHTAELASEFGGRVSQVHVTTGALVDAGKPLLDIDTSDVKAALGVASAEIAQHLSELGRAEARLEAAREKLARVEAGKKWLSARELEAARAEVRIAEADAQSSRSLVSMGRARHNQQRVRAEKHALCAPFRGRVASVDVDRGDAVIPGKVLVRFVSEDRQIKFAVPPHTLQGGPLREVWVAPKGSSDARLAKVHTVRPEVDQAAQMVFVTAELPDDANSAGLILGSDVNVFPAESRRDLLTEK